MFSICVAIKIPVLVRWLTTPVSLCQSNDMQLEIQKSCFYLKAVALDFVLLLNLYHILVIISLLLCIKFNMGQLLLFFLCNFCSFLRHFGGVLITNLFSLFSHLIDGYILAIQQIITHEEHFLILFLTFINLLN